MISKAAFGHEFLRKRKKGATEGLPVEHIDEKSMEDFVKAKLSSAAKSFHQFLEA